MKQLRVCADTAALAQRAAELVVSHARAAVEARGRFLFCLTGGSTPIALYRLLATDAWIGRVPWKATHVFFGDERCVPPDHQDSNYQAAHEALLSRVPVPTTQVHRMRGELEPETAAAEYAGILRDALSIAPSGAPAHGFDLLLLGLGDDAHIASLFPGSQDDAKAWTSARHTTKHVVPWRITLTPPVINQALSLLYLVSGDKKAAAVAAVLTGPRRPLEVPAQRVEPAHGSVTWLVDNAAAAKLPDKLPAIERIT